jgi:phosphopantothenoylcysteine decarboxylase/phosphopantothenate--cysteine ligase
MAVSSTGRFAGRRIVLGVTGSIAAYKAVSLLRALTQEGADVSVVMTESAKRFVAPLTFEVLSRHPVASDLFAAQEEMLHLALAEQAEAVVIAPATAHVLARCALGLADDLLGTLLLAAGCPVIVAPAMDGGMWHHSAVQAHVAALQARGVTVVEPEDGPLASGRIGKGRLAEEARILAALEARLQIRRDWAGQRVLISAGPTHEALDAVRFISNRSSGKMGYALAEASRRRGADVVLVSGPTALAAPPGVECVPVITAEEMAKALAARFPWCTVLFMAAAVADFRPRHPSSAKLKKRQAGLTVELEPTEDILETLAKRTTHQTIVGFAAETSSLRSQAEAKLKAKGLDLIVANDVGASGCGFGSETNAALLIDRHGRVTELPLMPKREMADRILDVVGALKKR